MSLLADVPDRARFALTLNEVLDLPVWLRTLMVDQINEWRSQEDAEAAKIRAQARRR